MGFRARQILALTVTATAVAIATGAIQALLLVRVQVTDAENRAESSARTFYHLIRNAITDSPRSDPRQVIGTDPSLRRYADALTAYSPVTQFVAVRDENGVAILHSNPDLEGQKLPAYETIAEFARRNPFSQLWTLSHGNNVLVADLPFTADGVTELGSVMVASSSLLLKHRIFVGFGSYALVAMGVTVLAFIGSFFVANRLLAPLERLRAELNRIDTGAGKPRLDLKTEADVGRLIEFFATMSGKAGQSGQDGWDRDSVRSMVDGLADAVVILDPEQRVSAVNDEACRLLARERGAMEGRTLAGILPEDHPVRAMARDALAGADAAPPRTVPLTIDGREVPHLLTAQALGHGRRAFGVLLTARNLERLSNLSSQITYSRKLAALGRLTSGVAHEIRNPLNALMLQAGLLRMKLGELDGDTRAHLDVVEQEIARLNRVVDGFLKFTRPEELSLEAVRLHDVVASALSLTSSRTEQAGIRVEVDADPGLPVIRGSADLLRQALLNLIGNACDAMEGGGVLRVRARTRAEGGIVLSIEDSGAGISAEDLPHVFNLFHTTKSSGSGIGLSLVYRIVQLHGGEIDIASKPGAGTRVTMTFPEVPG